MRMLRASVDAELAEHLCAEAVLREHALDGVLEDARREAVEHLAGRRERRAALIAGMTEVRLLDELLARELHFVCIDDDDVVTRIHMRRVRRFILAAKDFRDLSCEAADRLAFRVDNIPFALDIGSICHERGLHCGCAPP